MSVREELPLALEPWLTPDLVTYLEAIGSMFEQIELYSEDSDEFDGWTILLDVDRCPEEALPYLAQYVGERLPVGIDVVFAREWIKDAPNQVRGTNYSLFRAAQRQLTGSRLVAIRERDGAGGTDDVDRISVRTLEIETPNPAGTLADIMDVIDYTLILNYQAVIGQLWQDVKDGFATWGDVAATGDTWAALAANFPEATTFSRPTP